MLRKQKLVNCHKPSVCLHHAVGTTLYENTFGYRPFRFDNFSSNNSRLNGNPHTHVLPSSSDHESIPSYNVMLLWGGSPAAFHPQHSFPIPSDSV